MIKVQQFKVPWRLDATSIRPSNVETYLESLLAHRALMLLIVFLISTYCVRICPFFVPETSLKPTRLHIAASLIMPAFPTCPNKTSRTNQDCSISRKSYELTSGERWAAKLLLVNSRLIAVLRTTHCGKIEFCRNDFAYAKERERAWSIPHGSHGSHGPATQQPSLPLVSTLEAAGKDLSTTAGDI